MNKIIIVILALILAGAGIYYLTQDSSPGSDVTDTTQTGNNEEIVEVKMQVEEKEVIIGKSVEGRDITAYNYGEGNTRILFIGGIHGGYSWNTVLLAYELMDYIEANPDVIPNNVKVTVIPVLNPDGLNKVVGTAGRFSPQDVPASAGETVVGRFNAHTVDLNRNFDCDWQETGKWQSKTVSGGSKAFSEPESQAIKNYAEANKLSAVVTYYSAAGGVYASNCNGGISTETRALMNKYADASGYSAYDDFDFYEITGDMVNWFAKNNIPAISVLLTNHTNTEWEKNKKGLEALLNYHAQ